jgi:hypothetical protein
MCISTKVEMVKREKMIKRESKSEGKELDHIRKVTRREFKVIRMVGTNEEPTITVWHQGNIRSDESVLDSDHVL